MHWFLKTFILPLLGALRPAVIVEVGVELGTVTEPLLDWAQAHGAVLHSIDPSPKLEVDELLAAHAERLRFHRAPSLEALSGIAGIDLALIDGDHNWYTVINELRLLAQRAEQDRRRPPVILLHDIGWPYGRRDLYYDPETIPTPHRQPHARRGILPGRAELAQQGVNGHLENAQLEGTPANGVLTAVEDFIAESPADWRFHSIPGLSGLGVLLTAETLDAEEHEPLRALLESIERPAFLHMQCEAIEDARLKSEVRRARLKRKLAETELQLRVVDTSELDELTDRAVQLEEQLRLVSELEGRLQISLRDSANVALDAPLRSDREGVVAPADRGLTEQATLGPESAEASLEGAPPDGAEDAPPDATEDTSSLVLRHRLQLALATHDRLQAHLEETRTTLTAELETAHGETRQATRALDRLRGELAELKVEVELSDTQRGRLQSALARARADMDVADGERQALERRLSELAAARAAAMQVERDANAAADTEAARSGTSAAAGTQAAQSASANGGVAEREHAPARLEQDLADTRHERDELAYALARLQVPPPGEPSWERELELRGQQAFLDAYLRVLAHCAPSLDGRDPLSLPLPTDRQGLLCAADEPQEPAHPTVDIVVCVHDALADVRRCLASLLDVTGRRFRLVLVDDGSAEPTRAFLEDLAARHPAIALVRREEPPHGYTLAANAGLRACAGDYVVLLNSDTVLTPGWLQQLVDHGERHPQLGILGPLSNAASHQSVPELRHEGAWAVNPLPDWLTVEGMARIVQSAPRVDARLPFLNGFCYVIKRPVLEAIGHFDEQRFAEGYCEENDYSHRASKRGYHLGVATNVYVHHDKSRSYGDAGRNELARRHYEVFLDKHDRAEVQELVATMEASTALEPVRRAVAGASTSPQAMASLLGAESRPLNVVFILPGLADGGSGGSHSIYQEVRGMRALGIPARIALHAKAWPRAQAAYEDAADVFEVFADVDDLAAQTAGADVISATHFKSVELLRELRRRRGDFLPAYYVQDYEPFFSAPESDDLREAVASYTALPDLALFAKTHWLCNVVGARHGVPVHRVEPSIDECVFFASAPGDPAGERSHTGAGPAAPTPSGERLRVLAMIRPRTPRRQPAGTIAVLERLLAEFPGHVELSTFGCRHAELARLTRSRALIAGHLGVLSRAAVAEQLRGSDVFLDMSTYQAFGRSALEAMACGATAVVPQVGGAWEFVEDGVNALAVDTLDPEAVFQAVASLVDDRERVERMGAASLVTAARFSVVRASLSEYLLFERLHRQRFGSAGERTAGKRTTAEQTPGEQMTSERSAATGKQTVSEQMTTEQSSGQQTVSEHTTAEQTTGQQTTGERSAVLEAI